MNLPRFDLPGGPSHRWPFTAAAVLGAGAVVALVWLLSLPLPQIAPSAQSTKLLASGGEVIATLHGEENRTLVPLSQISPNLVRAVVGIEDRSFFDHRGFSLRGIFRAARANWEGGAIVQGGSTITQQYVRSAFPDVGRDRTFSRKLKEAFWAVKLERSSSKEEILEHYLNTVYFGRGAYGAEAAARTYFKVAAAELTPGQSAYLAGLIRAPERYQIDEDPARATRLRDAVIDQLAGLNLMTAQSAAAAKAEDLAAQFKPGVSIEADSAEAGYFVEYVRRLLRSEFQLTDEQILRGGLEVQTTLDVRMQRAAEKAVRTVLNRPTDPEAALVAMDTQGRVRAMVGGRDVDSLERARGFNFAADVAGTGGGRPAGSAFKTFALAAFLEEGKSIRSTFSGHSPISINSDRCRNGSEPWRVSNYGGTGYGYLDVTGATVNSVNTIYAQMMNEVVTPQKFMDVAARTGISIPASDAGCALTLGTSDVTPLEMAGAYTTFAQRGRRPQPLVVTKITRPSGAVVAERVPSIAQVMDANVADTVNSILRQNIEAGTGTGAKIGRTAAGKTGTAENFQDAWFAGYTPELTAVVWMGFPPAADGKIPVMARVRGRSVTGGSFPATIWKGFMSEALKGVPEGEFVEPEITGEVINHRPPAPRVREFEEFEVPSLDFPPCFPFCGLFQQRDPGDALRRQIEDQAERLSDMRREQRRQLREAQRDRSD
ncbi:MAG TPA: transglycosylase domain-containing protein [Actinomycetota bacterium]|nr:transglycosylase domain-containing protein [Actinomycetota bacterium]